MTQYTDSDGSGIRCLPCRDKDKRITRLESALREIAELVSDDCGTKVNCPCAEIARKALEP